MGMILVTASVAVFVWAVVGLIRPTWARLPSRASSVGVWVISVILLVVGISMLPDDPDGTTNEPERLAEALAYLNEIDDMTWVEVDSNNAYLGFASVPEDLALIVNAAAMNGNKVLGFGVHVWAVQADLGWRPSRPAGSFTKGQHE